MFISRQKKLKFKKNHFSINLLIGFIYLLAIATFTIANVFAPVSNVALLSQFVPIIVLILVYFAWKEKPTKVEIIALVLSIIALVIMNPIELVNNIGNIIALSNSLLVGIFVVLIRKYAPDNDLSFIFKYMLIATIMMFPFVLYYGFGNLNLLDLLLFILLGLVTGFGGVLRFIVLKHMNAGKTAIITSITTPLFAILLGISIIEERLNTNIILGGIILIMAIIFMNIQKLKRKKKS